MTINHKPILSYFLLYICTLREPYFILPAELLLVIVRLHSPECAFCANFVFLLKELAVVNKTKQKTTNLPKRHIIGWSILFLYSGDGAAYHSLLSVLLRGPCRKKWKQKQFYSHLYKLLEENDRSSWVPPHKWNLIFFTPMRHSCGN